MRLSWDDDQVKLWWNMKLWITVKDQLFSSSLLIKFRWNWWNWNECNPKWAGTPAIENDMRRGLPQEKEKKRAGTPAREKEKNGGDSGKRKKEMMIWRGLPQEKKGWASSNVRGCEFDKQTWRGENWPPKINYTYKWIVWTSVCWLRFGNLCDCWIVASQGLLHG